MTEPRRPFAGLSDAELERALADLGAAVAFPPTPDLAASVPARLAAASPPPPRRLLSPATFRRALAMAAIALLVLAAGLALWPGLRSAVAAVLGVRGIRIVIERGSPTPVSVGTPAPTPVGTGLLLGRPATIEEAQASVPYRIHVPTLPGLGEPDEVYVRTLSDGNVMVPLIYVPRPALPETQETDVGALLMQFEAREGTGYLAKSFASDGVVQLVDVAGREGWWITGATQLVMLQDPSAGWGGPTRRPSGNVLIWEQDGVTFRAIAESVRPPPPAATGTEPGP